ncbi:hypothetical protein [Paenisporosarcina sp. TG20]|uniref:hypothetical protein n=1 Tax=Paenisporosarcina sp. TG20 TaxID=1211706 RepID=UPI00035EBF45|nr:hypothetical protein [Paenisporosarcina sp. TG20]
MGMWTWPLMGVVLIISAIGFNATRRIMTFERKRQSANDSPIPESVKEHPFVLNPIIWVYLASLIFVSLLIFYYATSLPY